MTTNKKSPTDATPGQAPKEGTAMKPEENSSKFFVAQTPQARAIQHTALWISEHIHTGMTAKDMILVRGTLLSLAVGVEEMENNMCAAALAGGAA